MRKNSKTSQLIKGSLVIIKWAASWENRLFAYAKTKTQISFAVTAKLISAFVFATQIIQSLYFLKPKFQAYSLLRWLYSPVCVGPGLKPWRPVFSQRGSNNFPCFSGKTLVVGTHQKCLLRKLMKIILKLSSNIRFTWAASWENLFVAYTQTKA